MIKYYFIIILYTFISSLAAIFLKKASDKNKSFLSLCFGDKHFYIGGVLYFLASIGTIIALKYLPYGIVYALSSITYCWTLILAYLILSEKITKIKIIAIIIILTGVFLLVAF